MVNSWLGVMLTIQYSRDAAMFALFRSLRLRFSLWVYRLILGFILNLLYLRLICAYRGEEKMELFRALYKNIFIPEVHDTSWSMIPIVGLYDDGLYLWKISYLFYCF